MFGFKKKLRRINNKDTYSAMQMKVICYIEECVS